jgi:hypothetical protein
VITVTVVMLFAGYISGTVKLFLMWYVALPHVGKHMFPFLQVVD